MATIQQNLIYASFPSDREVENFAKTRYQFNGANGFEDWRLKQLVNIIESDINGMPRGSTQSNDVLIYDEWEYIQNPKKIRVGKHFNEIEEDNEIHKYEQNLVQLKNSVGVFENAVKNLKNKIVNFKSNNHIEDFEDVRNPEYVKDQLENSESQNIENLIKLVIECKEFIRDIHSEERQQSYSPSTATEFKGSEGSFIDILSFMEKDTEMSGLKNIFELSKIQTRKLDQAINGRIYEEHKRKIGEYKNAIVQGAGPVGLYATYKLFIEGVNVTLVNDRSEEYIRNRVVFFDRKWMSQLRFFLGTKFDELFDKEGKGRWLDEDIGLVNIKNMETVLKDRLKELALYVKKKEEEENPQEKSFLNLIYNTAVLDIDTENYQNPMAILGAPVKRSGSFNIEKLKGELNGISFFEHIDNKLAIPFDSFFCAGGAKDQIRDKFLEEARQLTESKNYGVAIFDKVEHDVKVFEDDSVFYRDPMEKMKPYLEKRKINKMISEAKFISKRLRKRYAKINDLIIEGMVEVGGKPSVKKEYQRDADGNLIVEQIVVRLFEINPTLHIASITPEALVKFIEELKNERNTKAAGNEHLFKKYDDFLEKLQKKWAKALFEYTFSVRHKERFKNKEVVIKDETEKGFFSHFTRKAQSFMKKTPKQTLKYDPYSANTSTFDVAIYGIENPVKYVRKTGEASTSRTFTKRKGEPIIAAIGDANTSAHFMTASGISVGRWAVDSVVNMIKQYNQNPEYLLELLNFVLKEVRRRVLEKAREYVQVFDNVLFDLNKGWTIQQFENRAN
ncbi:hypothetical protein ACQ4LE_006726 [Meloidogyne hapla]